MKKGFTIIELVIVISVLIILIGIAIPRMKGMQQSGQVVKVKGELQTLQAAMESYYSNNGNVYAPTSTTPTATYFVGQTPQIIASVMYDPFNNGTTEYNLVSSTAGFYAFGSVGTGGSYTAFSITGTGAVTHTPATTYCVTNGSGC